MKIKCVFNKAEFLPKDIFEPGAGFENKQFDVDIGKEYIVYGMTLYMSYVWYYLCHENYIYYPFWHPSPLFDVVDNRLSKYWIFSFERGKDKHTTYTNWVYPEWANDPYYYDKLTDGDEEEVEIFRRYKKLMDVEFPDASVSEKYTAIVGKEKGWLLCPECLEAWQQTSNDGMVFCPRCKIFLHNPLYIA